MSISWYHRNKEKAAAKQVAYKARRGEEGRIAACVAGKKYREKYKDRVVSNSLRYRFGITLEQYNELLSKQNGVCAICKQPETRICKGIVGRLGVDHDHKCCPGGERSTSCGKCVRGLLCHNCNIVLGLMDDNPEFLRSAAMYLEETGRSGYLDGTSPEPVTDEESKRRIN